MGLNVSAVLCYGVVMPEGFKYPWRNEGRGDWPTDMDRWWARMNGVGEESLSYGEVLDWVDNNPCPAEMVVCGNADDPIFILAMRQTELTAEWVPRVIGDDHLKPPSSMVRGFVEFMREYIVSVEGCPESIHPHWVLGRYVSI